ncbi:hypothetical protein PL78_18750 [Yersinia entomophaga]|uniref:DUF4225 domain-containing protein n=1 Tax=Yersinia entomophaga TaxID=935293 RepID=A0ABN4Q2M3_YERET|nr:DUF4225 domain-containing protein [Yersinia entomophaga]ANI31851.1 hypothetical protein PL78_18750 [Yersinia entomophaga]OWF84785.1 hypothetical protein B4914_18685 [Yersinia entomophaga]
MAEASVTGYRLGRLQFSEANTKLHDQYQSLLKVSMSLHMGNAKLYAIVERKKEQNSITNIILKQVGFVSGWLKIIGGGGICYTSLGAACSYLGSPLLLHGSENVWENGYYLLYREDPSLVPLRNVYRQSARILGGDDKDGDIAFSIGDLSLSAGSLFRSVLKKDAWKLFHHIREDYIIGWRDMGAAGLISEVTGDSTVGLSLYQLINGSSTNWEDLSEKK